MTNLYDQFFNTAEFTPKGKWAFARMREIEPNVFVNDFPEERALEVFQQVLDEADVEFASHDQWREVQGQ